MSLHPILKKFVTGTDSHTDLLRGVITAVLPFCWFFLLDVCFRWLYYVSGCAHWYCSSAMLFTLCWSGLLAAFLQLLPPLPRRIMTAVLTAAECLILLLHAVMYNLTGSFFSMADLSFAGDGAAFFSTAYLHFRLGLLLVVAVTVILCALTIFLTPKTAYRWYRPAIAAAVILLCCLGIWRQDTRLHSSEQSELSWDTATYNADSDESVYSSLSDINRAFHLSGSYQYLFRSIMVSSGLSDYLSSGITQAALDDYYAGIEPHETNSMSGIFEGKNLILIQLEDIDTWMLTEEYMPNLYRLQQLGTNWSNHYAPLYSSAATFSTEFTVNTGAIIPNSGITTKAFTSFAYPYSLAHLFRSAGYSANSFHAAAPAIYNRGEIHANWGYEAYHSHVEMGMTDYQRDSEMLGGYSEMVSDSPFLSFIITYSGHGPYTEELDNICEGHWDQVYAAVDPDTIPAEGEDLEEYYRAVAHAMETDAFVGGLIDRLTADGHLEDTVLFFYTDHYCKYMTNEDLIDELKGTSNKYEKLAVPCFFYYTGMEPSTVEKVTSTPDILPTIANLFGLEADYRYYPGTDIYSSDTGLVMFQDYDWYDGETWHIAGTASASNDPDTSALVRKKLNYTWAAMKRNYLAGSAE